MTVGRKPKPTALKLVTGNPGKRPLPKKEAVVALAEPTPPAFLCDDAKVECGWLDGGLTMIFQVLAFPDETAARWRYLYSADNFGDDPYADPATTDPMELAKALRDKGVQVAVVFPE